MRLELGMFQGIKCRACDGYMHDHEAECPQRKLADFCEESSRREHRCPKCHRGDVALNKADFFECRKCHTQFSTSPACGEDAETLEHTYLLADTAIRVVVMTLKGDGKFMDDAVIAMLRRDVTETIARRSGRSTRKRTPTVYQRLMREIREEAKRK